MSDQSVADLLHRAAAGDKRAWDAIVDRYIRLVWSVVRGFRLDDAAADDVVQTVWLRLVENCDKIRDPERLPGWLATTTRNESLRVLKRQKRQVPTDFEFDVEDPTRSSIEDLLVDDEQQQAVAAAFRQMPEGCQQLLRLLCADPPLEYSVISEIIGRPVGSLGPTRKRCLDRLRDIMAKTDGGAP